MSPLSRHTGRRGRTPALIVGLAGFIGSALAAMFLEAAMPTWIAGYLAFWTFIGSVMAGLWPAPVPTRAQVAATRGEEDVAWPAVRARLIPVFSPWFVGLGAFVGMGAADRGWGGSTVRFAAPPDELGVILALALCIFLAPLGVLLFTNVTFPVLYALRTTGTERQWGLARATGPAGLFGLLTCAIFALGSDQVSQQGQDPGTAAIFVGRLFLGDSGWAPGWLVPLVYVSVTLIAFGISFLVKSERPGHDEASPAGHDVERPPERH